MSVLIQFLVGHSAMFLGGATCLLLVGAIAVLAVRTPIHRQRMGEMTILAVLVWLILACLPLPRPTSWFWREQRTVPVVAENRSAG